MVRGLVFKRPSMPAWPGFSGCLSLLRSCHNRIGRWFTLVDGKSHSATDNVSGRQACYVITPDSGAILVPVPCVSCVYLHLGTRVVPGLCPNTACYSQVDSLSHPSSSLSVHHSVVSVTLSCPLTPVMADEEPQFISIKERIAALKLQNGAPGASSAPAPAGPTPAATKWVPA